MKQFILLFVIFLISVINCANFNNLFRTDPEIDDSDPEDIMIRMKSFLDGYTNNLKTRIKTVDKIIVPTNTTLDNSKTIYVNKFNVKDFNKESQQFADELIKIIEKDLRATREDKQILDEKNIDQITRNKILKSKLNLSSGEKTKSLNDFNEKDNLRKTILKFINDSQEEANCTFNDDINNLNNLKNEMNEYQKNLSSLKLNNKIIEDDISVQNSLEKIKSKIYQFGFETNLFKTENKTQSKLINDLEQLLKLFTKEIKSTNQKIMNIENSIINKKEKLESFKKNMQNKFDNFERMNQTVNKLDSMKKEYKDIVRNLDDELNILKSKKKIISENIIENKKQRLIKNRTIEKVLSNLEKQLNNYNSENVAINKHRKEITQINNRIKNLLLRENLIFKNNKIKI